MEIGEERLGSKVLFSVEREPLGTAGPIRLAREMLGTGGSFIVVNGDIVSDIDLAEMVKAHKTIQLSRLSLLCPRKTQGSMALSP